MTTTRDFKGCSEANHPHVLRLMAQVEAHRLNEDEAGLLRCEQQLRERGYTAGVALPGDGETL